MVDWANSHGAPPPENLHRECPFRQSVVLNPYDDLDTLYDFLKNIMTVDEFFEKKEPSHDDEFMREVALLDIATGIPEEYAWAVSRQQNADAMLRPNSSGSFPIRRSP